MMGTNANVAAPAGSTMRMMPPPVPTGFGAQIHSGANPIIVNGRTYTAAIGTVIDVLSHDASQMASNGWTQVALSGATAARPTGTALARGLMFFDTTVGSVICYDGLTWRNPASGAAV